MLLFNKPTAISYISKSGDKIYPVVIDIKEGVKSSETLSFMTADSNTGILSVAFMEGETIYNIDDATVVCDIERPDGTDLSIGAVKVADGVVEVPLGVNGTSQPGMYMFDFKIVRPGSKTIGVPLVSYTVTQSINTDEIVTQDDRLPVLNDLIVKIQNATSASTQATNECKTATNNVNNTLKSVNNAIASGTVDLELKQLRTSLNGTLHPTANDRINQMETHLLEATATTIETESNFNTVDATSNGYFEDVKLEGKTLVNLCTHKEPILINGTRLITQSMDFKLNTTYTIIFTSDKIANRIEFTFRDGGGSVHYTKKFITTVNAGLNIIKLHISSNISNIVGSTFYIAKRGEDECTISNIVLLEGDHTNNPPEYFEGLLSVGQDVEEVSVESVSRGNLIDLSRIVVGKYIANNNVDVEHGTSFYCDKYVKVYPGVKYKFMMSDNSKQIGRVLCYDKDGNYITSTEYSTNTPIYFDSTVDTVRLSFYNRLHLKDMLYFGTDSNYVSQIIRHNKKPLLYFNPTTETWEKPILRAWDTIEKHSDGKYYYHKRSGEVVLNGSESWWKDASIGANTTRYGTNIQNAQNTNTSNKLICNLFTCSGVTTYGTDVEDTQISGNSLYVRINTSKAQDVEGFKAWLKANPTTVVYQLAQEEVYECTNIDLMTYSGETNYIINSGAISPKSLLKVHNNISNVVKILQEKVSLLENMFISGLKSVLSGDMYSLATILYPEDFEQNDNTEQDIMVIPE